MLEEAFELFSALRLEHQVRQLEQSREPDDRLDPEELDPLTRRYLRDAFREVAAVQRSLGSGAALAPLERERPSHPTRCAPTASRRSRPRDALAARPASP